jgi:hypothetical protein
MEVIQRALNSSDPILCPQTEANIIQYLESKKFFDTLSENFTNQDNTIKNVSITTMGYICEQIKNMGKTINERLS